MRVMLDKNAREIDGVTGRRYRSQSGGIFDMHKADAKALVELGGAVCSLGPVSKSRHGYRCPVCNFGSWFRICSRCGAQTLREQLATCKED